MPKALFVDDSNTATKIAQKLYSDVCDLVCVSDMAEAVLCLAEEDFDIFIVDYHLGKGNGIELVRVIRNMEQYEKTPVLLVSSGMSSALAYCAMKAGVNESFDKIAATREIKEAIAEQLTDPYTREVELDSMFTRCLAWQSENLFFEYSPELDLTLSGVSKESVHKKMADTLKEGFQSKEEIAVFGDDIDMVYHYVDIK